MITFNVLTDLSEAGTNALRYVVLLSRHVMAHVHLVHVLPTGGARGAEFFQVPGPALTELQVVENLAASVREISRYVPCSFEVVTEAPAEALPKVLSRSPRSVTVLGNSNTSRTSDDAWLSTALYLVRTQPHPLLVVPATYWASEAPRQIMFDTDGRSASLAEAARPLAELLYRLTRTSKALQLSADPDAVDQLLTKLAPSLIGLHIYTTEQGPAHAEVAGRLDHTGLLDGLPFTVETARHWCVETGILHAAQQRASLLAFVTRQLTFAGPEFFNSVTAGLLLRSPIPVLTVPEAEPSLHPWQPVR